MIKAMEHPLIDVIGHPTGRLIERRPPYALDVDKVIAAAVRTGTFLEINANPNRRDLNEVHARQAVEAGATLTIDSDAHGVETLAQRALRHRDGAARLDRPGVRGQHAALGRARRDAQVAACAVPLDLSP